MKTLDGRKAEILVVEDEAELRENICIILQLNGYEVKYAENGMDALKMLNSINPDLIISDIMMPQIDGYELYERIRNEERFRFTPFIFLTAKSDLQSLRQGLNIGVDDYITKPFSADDLLKSIETRLEKIRNFNKKIEKILSGIRVSLPHELRTPLVGILGLSELIINDHKEYSKEEILDFVERIHVSSKRLLNRIEKFLHLTDLELLVNSNSEIKNYELDINEEEIKLIAFDNFIVNPRMKDIFFHIEKSKLKIHPKFFSALISELLENACKFSSDGSKINLIGSAQRDLYKLSFEDQGKGMAEIDLKNLTEFFMVDKENGKIYGNGIGLVFVKRAVNLFNGKIELDSKLDEGTKVNIFLPICPNEEN